MALALAGYAQTFRGAVNGTVADPSGAVVPGASVKITNTATGISQATTSTTNGEFAFQELPLGTYQVDVTAKGFTPTRVANVVVTAGKIYTLPVKLAVGQQATTVEVSAAALTVDTTTQTVTTTIPTTALQNVPLNGRDFSQLIAVSPGYGGYSVGGFGSLNGTRANQMNWQIDGTDNNDLWHNIPAVNQGGVSGIAGTVLPIDAVDEFSAQTQSSAETGRSAGGTINLALKSGTNTLHGTAYLY
ncbi:MAG TPA: carboxypeptidase-like regulatory domain-containing protein, partial [Terriglobales bacterium]|nr:carboxypeptidase-like regulatory domain-containing protein [Terriglobales bacterium]